MKDDIIIIGGGIVGCATGLRLIQTNPKLRIRILEKESTIGQHQTGNNSGVIHSGLYYKPGSLKAKNCISGYHELLEFCDKNDVPYDRCGKIVVATSTAEESQLETLYQRGQQNGLEGLKLLDVDELTEYEPHVAGTKGMFVPQTGIIDYKQVIAKYLEVFLNEGGNINYGQKVVRVNANSVITENEIYEGKLLINCAGLYSDKIARLTSSNVNLKIIPFRGEYYKLKEEKRGLVKNLIYPVPDPNFPFLGVHFTRMMNGEVEAGPNAVLAYAREGYSKWDINIAELFESLTWPGFLKVASKYWRTGLGEVYRSYSKAAFTKALQKLMPEITTNDLEPGGAGVRAQACDRNGGLIDDFLILEEKTVINVCNAPSPAATSSLAIGKTVANLAIKHL